MWNKQQRKWTLRKKNYAIGRMYNINPSVDEQFYLRLLLTKCRGCKNYQDLKIFNGFNHDSFKGACIARGLLETDEEWTECLFQASLHRTGLQLRNLFATIFLFCEPISPISL